MSSRDERGVLTAASRHLGYTREGGGREGTARVRGRGTEKDRNIRDREARRQRENEREREAEVEAQRKTEI